MNNEPTPLEALKLLKAVYRRTKRKSYSNLSQEVKTAYDRIISKCNRILFNAGIKKSAKSPIKIRQKDLLIRT